MKLELSLEISKKYSTIKFRDVRNIGTELFHVDGWPDMAKLLAAFRIFSDAPRNHKSVMRSFNGITFLQTVCFLGIFGHNFFTRIGESFDWIRTILDDLCVSSNR